MNARFRERGSAAALAAVLIWGLVPVGTRFFVLRLDPLSFNVIRATFSGAGALPLIWMAKPWRWPASQLWLLLLCAVLAVPGYNIPVAFAAQSLPAGRVALLIATEPLFIIFFGAWLHRRQMRWQVALGAVIAFIGVAFTSERTGPLHTADTTAALLVLAGAMSWALYTVLVASLSERYGALHVTGGVVVLGAVVLIAVSLPLMPTVAPPTAAIIGQIGALGLLSSLIGFLLWNHAASRVASDRLGLFLYMIPAVSLLVGALVLGESFTWELMVGGALTLAGVALGERRVLSRNGCRAG